ncbi:hypothetical protein LIER_27369 [Lithospermum erythrorhizon]|uniref:Uncharacterized protein n=1 Tax=Lithospermum erythrorhizon TaxID=34254 RepID=A0AAV3RC29_LITER
METWGQLDRIDTLCMGKNAGSGGKRRKQIGEKGGGRNFRHQKGGEGKEFGVELEGMFKVGMMGKVINRGTQGRGRAGKGRWGKLVSGVIGNGLKGISKVDNAITETESLVIVGGDVDSEAAEGDNGRWMDRVSSLNMVETHSEWYIEVEVAEVGKLKWRGIFVYASCDDNTRMQQFQTLLRLIPGDSLGQCLIGDFNDILDVREKEGGNGRSDESMRHFREFV